MTAACASRAAATCTRRYLPPACRLVPRKPRLPCWAIWPARCPPAPGWGAGELEAWDIAAGLLRVKEAGGMVAPIREGYDILEKGALLCANDPLFEPLKKIIRDE